MIMDLISGSNDYSKIILLLLVVITVLVLVLLYQALFISRKRKKEKNEFLDQKNETDITNVFEAKEVIQNPNSSFVSDIAKQMESDLEETKINLTSFEEEQEGASIISYEELVNTYGKKELEIHEENVRGYEIDNNEEPRYRAPVFISSVYGVEQVKEETRPSKIKPETIRDLEQTINLGPLASEVKKTNEFLEQLKEFRKNLD